VEFQGPGRNKSRTGLTAKRLGFPSPRNGSRVEFPGEHRAGRCGRRPKTGSRRTSKPPVVIESFLSEIFSLSLGQPS
jgi:hypothetical protein